MCKEEAGRDYELEGGSATLTIELRGGNILVRHGEQYDVILAELMDAPQGTWDMLWAAFEKMGLRRPKDIEFYRGY